jgi:hypothetical protein
MALIWDAVSLVRAQRSFRLSATANSDVLIVSFETFNNDRVL